MTFRSAGVGVLLAGVLLAGVLLAGVLLAGVLLAGVLLAGGLLAGGLLAGVLLAPAVAANSSTRSAAVTVTSPAAAGVIVGAEPDVVRVSGPLRGICAAVDVKSRQPAVAELVPSVTSVLRPAVSVTVDAGTAARPETAACGRVTAIRVPVGWIGLPTVPDAGNVAVTWASTGCDWEPKAQV